MVDGQVVYDANGAFGHLLGGETTTDSFQYAIRMGNGTISIATATITIEGVDDDASIIGTSTGTVTEGAGVGAQGTLTVIDSDRGPAVFAALEADDLSGTYGDFTFDNGAWTYTLRDDDPAVTGLRSGQTVEDTLRVWSADGSSYQDIVVDVNGVSQNLLVNPGFETGDFTGWSTAGSTTVNGTQGVGRAGDLIQGGYKGDAQVAVQTGDFAAYGLVAGFEPNRLNLTQKVYLEAGITYTAGYSTTTDTPGLGGNSVSISNAALNGVDHIYSAFPRVFAPSNGEFLLHQRDFSVAEDGYYDVTFSLTGSGAGAVAMSYDDFFIH